MDVVDLTFNSDNEDGAPRNQPSPLPRTNNTSTNEGLSTPLRRLLDLQNQLNNQQQSPSESPALVKKRSGINTARTATAQLDNTINIRQQQRRRDKDDYDDGDDDYNNGNDSDDDDRLIVEGRRSRRRSKKYDNDDWTTDFPEDLSQQQQQQQQQQDDDGDVFMVDDHNYNDDNDDDMVLIHSQMTTDDTTTMAATTVTMADTTTTTSLATAIASIRKINTSIRGTTTVRKSNTTTTRHVNNTTTTTTEQQEEDDDDDDSVVPKRGGKKPRKTAAEKAQEKLEKQRLREEKKQQQAAEAEARKRARHFLSDKNILHYLSVAIDPGVMMNPLGPKIILAFQETHTLAEHEHIKFSVSATNAGNLPAIMWNRKVPSSQEESFSNIIPDSQQTTATGGGGLFTTARITTNHNQPSSSSQPPSSQSSLSSLFLKDSPLIEVEEKHVLLCFDAEEFVQHVFRDEMSSVFEILQQRCPDARVYILVHRLEQYLKGKERADHRRAMKNIVVGAANDQSTMFNRLPIDLFVNKMHIERPLVGFRDVSSAEEGAKYVVSLTKAIAKQILAKSEAIELLSHSKSSSNKTKSFAAALLASFPIENQETRTCMHALCAIPSVGPQIAHSLASKYGNFGAFMKVMLDPSQTFNQKAKMIEQIPRTSGTSTATRRIGPKAARDIVEFFTCNNPNLLIHGD